MGGLHIEQESTNYAPEKGVSPYAFIFSIPCSGLAASL